MKNIYKFSVIMILCGISLIAIVIADAWHVSDKVHQRNARNTKFKFCIKLESGRYSETYYTDFYSASVNLITFTNEDNHLILSDSKWIIEQQH